MMRSLAVLFTVLALAACATPAIQPPLTPPAGFAGPALAGPPLCDRKRAAKFPRLGHVQSP